MILPIRTSGLLQCCMMSLERDAPKEPTEGVEVPCRHCSDYMKFVDGAWEHHTKQGDWIVRESSPDRTAARQASLDRISVRFEKRLADEVVALKHLFVPASSIDCQKCGERAGFLDTSDHGVTTYLCDSKHVSFIDHSRELRRR